jgi:hypothetical protein
MREDADDLGTAKCLVIFLRPRLTLGEMTSWPYDKLDAFGEQYTSIAGEWTGFYDWLRDHDRTLLGVRYWPFESTQFVIRIAKELSYVHVVEEKCLEIFFSSHRASLDHLSSDQDFLYDPVYTSHSGACALAFSTEDLSESDNTSIRNANAEWVPI